MRRELVFPPLLSCPTACLIYTRSLPPNRHPNIPRSGFQHRQQTCQEIDLPHSSKASICYIDIRVAMMNGYDITKPPASLRKSLSHATQNPNGLRR
ncbi:hypothetical protein L211DRAFT_550325 [Terfezia boudieri ATCC MYA-4762]|uniref:Uncharacterized protein n=1 Tax=Terfezia boudieri ATCC MYA-4762 TaxID=1051890 RepID=A0A3N4LX62_9PEZI|nr:hypothetical protein L211DRAFT_550325 [Terfezia boudieri ATCC MYA-4762]